MNASADEILEIESLFPNLKQCGGFIKTSDRTVAYNCVALAMGESHRWWEGAGVPGYYWPTNFHYDGSVKCLATVLRAEGFKKCNTAELDVKYEKVAIYADGEEYTHIARQADDGTWTSKLGKLADISHKTLEGLIGSEYGVVTLVMKRKRKNQ